jgi:hypothetical protein
MKYLLCSCNKTILHFLLIFVSLLSLNSFAQEAQGTKVVNLPYEFSSGSTTYTPLSDGITVTKLSVDDAVSDKLPLGFSFQLGCKTYTDFYASSNGTLSFNYSFLNHSNGPGALTQADLTLLAPLWDDLGGAGGTFSYSTTGAAPNRVFTAEWKNWKWYNNTSLATISFQVKLYEGSNTIEYIYKQEPFSNLGPATASIGMFNGHASIESKQLWLNTSGENPTASTNLITTINTRPANGQVYRFTPKDNDTNCEVVYYGRTIINEKGGTNAKDGLRIILSGAGNMQVKKGNANQIYSSSNELLAGTSNPYGTPGSSHGIVLAVGNTYFAGGTLTPGAAERLQIVSSTKQSLIESSPGHFVNEIKLAATKNGLNYYLTVKYTYILPENYFLIDYTVDIPAGNTEDIKLAHGWDTYLNGEDKGPGFVTGTAPNFIVGVKKEPSYEAFEYLGGKAWSGYYSAVYSSLNSNLGSDMAFKKTINSNSDTDNGIGISINFGNVPGSFTSNNKLVFGCEAGSVAPVLAPKGGICKGGALDLNSLITSPTPLGSVLVWKKDGKTVTNPTAVTIDGTYTAIYNSTKYTCDSPTSSTLISYDNTCGICYKPGATNGKEAGSLTIISTLDRKNHPDLNKRNGALILESNEKGVAISRMASPETTITAPVEGMLVYDTTRNCLKLYNGTTWNCIQQTCVDNK